MDGLGKLLHVYGCVSVCMYICVSVCLSVCLYVCMSVCLYVFTYIRMYVCMYVCVYLVRLTSYSYTPCTHSCHKGNGRLKVYDMEAKCFESDMRITESQYGKSVRLVGLSNSECTLIFFASSQYIITRLVLYAKNSSYRGDKVALVLVQQNGPCLYHVQSEGLLTIMVMQLK